LSISVSSSVFAPLSSAVRSNQFFSPPASHFLKSMLPLRLDSPNPPPAVPSIKVFVPLMVTGLRSIRNGFPLRKESGVESSIVPTMLSKECILTFVFALRFISPFPFIPSVSKYTVMSNSGFLRPFATPLPLTGTPSTLNPASLNTQSQEAISIFPLRFLILILGDT